VTEIHGYCTGNEFQTLGVENGKARDPNVKLWRGTEDVNVGTIC